MTQSRVDIGQKMARIRRKKARIWWRIIRTLKQAKAKISQINVRHAIISRLKRVLTKTRHKIISALTYTLAILIISYIITFTLLAFGKLADVFGFYGRESLHFFAYNLTSQQETLQKVLKDTSSTSSEDVLFMIAITATLLISIIVINIFRDEKDIEILPSEIGTDEEKYNNKFICSLLTAELNRVNRIHARKYKGIRPVKLEDLSLPTLAPLGENLSYGLSDLGNIGVGSISMPVGQLLVAFRRFFPFRDPGRVITVSLQKYETMISLVAQMEHREIYAWEVRHEIKPYDEMQDDWIPYLVRDISFKIAKDLSPKISAKTWQGFKYFTESLDGYHLYTLTGDETELVCARENALKAANAELGYEKPLDLLYNMGMDYFNKNRYIEAKLLFYMQIAFKPDAGAFVMVGDIYKKLNQTGKAGEAYEKAVMLSPQCALDWSNKGVAHCRLGNHKEGLECYKKALDLDIEHLQARINKSNAHINLEEYEKAIKSYDWALDTDPRYVRAWYNKGIALSKLDKIEEALKCYEVAIELGLKSATTHITIACLYRKLNRDDEYTENCTIARNLIEKDDEYTHACFEAVCGSAEEAIALLRIALKKEQSTPDWARQDPDFEFIRDDPRFQALLNKASEGRDPS